ncbi:MAG: protein arginine kinase [Pelosinus sp.]|nr:protein arginine kinase [Pelosinus sp.]
MSIETMVGGQISPWMTGGGRESDIVLSSRVRLARNLDGIPFPNRADTIVLQGVIQELGEAVPELSAATGKPYILVKMGKLTPLERYVLVEKHIISPSLAQHAESRALIVEEDAAVSIMINEEDHLRIQCMAPGLALTEAFQSADKIDDVMEARHNFGFNEQMGYLTACPTNLGTGLRASVMLHLPALGITRQLNRIVNAATQLGLAVRGLYGEGSEAAGNVFQISNQLTLGHTEQEIIDNLYSVVTQVVEHERSARCMLMRESENALSDKVWRSYGILRYARSISGQEALAMLSEVRLGIDLGIIDTKQASLFNELLIMTRPNYLQKVSGSNLLAADARDRLRADVIRSKLAGRDEEYVK